MMALIEYVFMIRFDKYYTICDDFDCVSNIISYIALMYNLDLPDNCYGRIEHNAVLDKKEGDCFSIPVEWNKQNKSLRIYKYRLRKGKNGFETNSNDESSV